MRLFTKSSNGPVTPNPTSVSLLSNDALTQTPMRSPIMLVKFSAIGTLVPSRRVVLSKIVPGGHWVVVVVAVVGTVAGACVTGFPP